MPFEDQVTVARVRNPDASGDLELVVLLECNTPSETISFNVRTNAARDDLPWLGFTPAHGGVIAIVGGGPSAADSLAEIASLKAAGAYVMALNGASSWLRVHGIEPDCQCIIDARAENVALLDKEAPAHLLASQVDPKLAAATRPVLMHLMTASVEDCLPDERRAQGGYAMIGGGYGVGNSAICAAYVMGYRVIHCFGFDSSHRDGRGHAYPQPMNDDDTLVDTLWDGVVYTSSLSMKAHAERFQIIASDLERMGCAVQVHGDGLLPAMWRMRGRQLSEQSKYRLLWSTSAYREHAPGEAEIENFLAVTQPDGLILDYGCGTGRAAVRLHRKGHDVLLVDFAENCRDALAADLAFLEWDLTEPLPVSGQVGFCTDVMEHIPPDDTRTALANMFAATPRIYFRIDTQPDSCGALIGATLHMALRSHGEWRELLAEHGRIAHEEERDGHSVFYVVKQNG